jgi:O-antigen ligase
MYCAVIHDRRVAKHIDLSNNTSASDMYVWNAIDASALALGLWLHAQIEREILAKIAMRLLPLLLVLAVAYVLQLDIQQDLRGSRLYLFGVLVADGEPFKSPHTSMYAACCIVLALCFWQHSASKLAKLWMPGVILASLYYVAIESWRPVWVGLVCAFGIVLLVKIRAGSKKVHKILVTFLLVQVGLLATDFAGYRTRWLDLLMHAAQEERVQIWVRTWTAITQAQAHEQWVGHGLGSFRAACSGKVCLGSNGGALVEHSPHNIFLDTLFSSGILGLIATLLWLAIVFRHFWIAAIKTEQFGLADSGLAILVILTVVCGLNFPLLSYIFVFPLALISGLVWFDTTRLH